MRAPLRNSIWLGLTLVLITLAGLTLAALLLSSARQSLDARIKFAFQPIDSTSQLDPRKLAIGLASRVELAGSSTSLGPEGPYWLYAEVTPNTSGKVLLEVRHLRADEARFDLLPRNSSSELTPLAWRHVKGGIVIELPASQDTSLRIIGRITPRYAMVLKFFAWDPEVFEQSVEGFNRMGGALAGACAVLALTMGLLGLRNRDFVAVLFGLTVLLMLRVAAFNSGWDLQWLGMDIPIQVMMPLIRATLPLAAIAQTSLFILLFARELRQLGLYWPTVIACGSFGALFLWSPFADHEDFLRAFWLMTAPGAAWLLYVLVRVIGITRDRSAQLYAAALGVTMGGVIAEIAYFMGLWDTRISASLLGVLIGSAINAAAVAERIYTERARAIESQRRELAALREKEDNFQSSPIPLFEFDANGSLRHFNHAFSRFLKTAALTGDATDNEVRWNKVFGELIPLSALSEKGVLESARIEPSGLNATDARPMYVDLNWTKVGTEVRGSVQDVTDREIARQAMHRMINHDQLTGVLNVHGLLTQTTKTATESTWSSYSLALVDLSRFESIHELFGHESGDVVLKSFARRLDGHCLPGELVARVGADTFVVFFPNLSIEDAAKRVRDIASACTNFPIAVGGKAIAVSVCVGIVCQSESLGLEQAIGASLRTTQRAKRRRSGAVTIALETPESLTQYLNEKRLLGRIADRLPTENFFQVMQPIVNIRHPRRKFAAEALIRMRADNGEIIPPDQFIAAAERNGMMPEIDRWTLRTACEWLNEHRTKLDGLEYLTVNVSGVSLNDVQFHADVRTMLADFPVEARKVCFEITESIAVSDIEATTRFTEQLRSMGARVALDDFGAGYTSFGYLRTIPAEILKIDGEIIKSVATDPSSTAILRAIRDIASDLGMRCVAEYVANFETLRALRELDIDYGQGFALCRPVDPSSLLSAKCSADIIADAEVVRYLDLQAGRAFTTQHLRMTAT